MKSPEFVDQILDLTKLGWGKRRIAKGLGTTEKTVKRYLKQGKWVPYKRKNSKRKLQGLESWRKPFSNMEGMPLSSTRSFAGSIISQSTPVRCKELSNLLGKS